MALMSDALEMCARALRTYVSSYTGRSARLFFMLRSMAHKEPWDTW
jgi:hypothetical protein